MLVLWGGNLYFFARGQALPESAVVVHWKFVKFWLAVVLGQNQGEIQSLKEEFETEKQLFGISWNFADEKFDSSKILHLLKHSKSLFLSLSNFSRNDGILLDRFEKGVYSCFDDVGGVFAM